MYTHPKLEFMVNEQSLLKFIASLNKSERRYFTLLTKLQKRTPEYVKLYKRLKLIPANAGEMDKIIPTKVKGISNLSRAKKQLYDQSLKSLRLQYDQTFIEDEINQDICEANLLKKKGLTQQCAARYDIAKEKAIRYECHYQHCTIIDRQLILAMNNLKKGILDNIESLHEEKSRVLEQINTLQFFEKKRHQVMMFYRRDSHLRKEDVAAQAEALLYELLDTLHTATTFFAQISYHNALTLLYRLNQDKETTVYHFEEMLKLWELPEYSHLQEAYQDRYKLDVYNYLGALHGIGAFDDYETILAKLEPYPARFLEEEVEDFQNVHFYLFLKHLNINDYDKARVQAKLIETKIDEYSQQVEVMIESRIITMNYNIAIFYFIYEKFSDAESWFLRILHFMDSKEQRQDLKYLCPIFLLIIAYEQGIDEEELEKMSIRFAKFLQRKESYYDFEKTVLTYLKKLIRCVDYEKKALFAEMANQLEEVKESKTIRNGVQEVWIWTQSRLNAQPMKDFL